ncbi:DNA polymerase IV [Thermodesulfobacteriota bacterium]
MILHIDMDAFYASVERLDNPDLIGKCIIVGGKSNRSVVSAASYEARAFGVHSAMPIFQARQKCPEGVFIRPRMKRYKEISDRVMDLLNGFTPLIEAVSIDEAFMDISGSGKLYGSSESIGRQIKAKIKQDIALTCSVGIAPLRFLAKIASDLDKPDGLVIIRPEEVEQFIETLPIRKVPGVGKKTYEQLALMGVKTLGNIRQYPEQVLIKRLGKFGSRLKALSSGEDPTPVVPYTSPKSISSERTLSEDTNDIEQLKGCLLSQAEIVAGGLRKEKVRAKTIVLKIKYSDFQSISKNHTLSAPTRSSEAIYATAERLLLNLKLKTHVRLIGLGASGFVPADIPVQAGLFDKRKESDGTWEKVDSTLDRIKEKYGSKMIARASQKNDEQNESKT